MYLLKKKKKKNIKKVKRLSSLTKSVAAPGPLTGLPQTPLSLSVFPFSFSFTSLLFHFI